MTSDQGTALAHTPLQRLRSSYRGVWGRAAPSQPFGSGRRVNPLPPFLRTDRTQQPFRLANRDSEQHRRVRRARLKSGGSVDTLGIRHLPVQRLEVAGGPSRPVWGVQPPTGETAA